MLKFFDEILKKKKKEKSSDASPWPFSRVTDSGRGSRPVPIRGWSQPATATIPSNAPVQRPSRPSPRRGPARSLRPFRPGSRAPANENSFRSIPGPFFYDRGLRWGPNDRLRSPLEPLEWWKAQHFRKGARERSNESRSIRRRRLLFPFFLRESFREKRVRVSNEPGANEDKNEWW